MTTRLHPDKSRSRHDPETLRAPCRFEVKADDSGLFTEVLGYASTFGNVDSYGDTVIPGAFTKTISERVERGIVPLLDSHQWDSEHTMGKILEAEEDETGLRFRASLSSSPRVQDIALKMSEGVLGKTSIGFETVRDAFVRKDGASDGPILRELHEIRLLEVSVVPIAADEHADLISVKSPASRFVELPIAASHTWDAAAAMRRVMEHCRVGTDAPLWAKYRRAFAFWNTRDEPTAASGGGLICDVVDGSLAVVPEAVYTAAARVSVIAPEDLHERVLLTLGRHIDAIALRLDGLGRLDADAGVGHTSRQEAAAPVQPRTASKGRQDDEHVARRLADLGMLIAEEG